MRDGFAICLAWPETRCKQAGAWYDWPMRLIRFNRAGYYKVGHAAVVLVEPTKKKCFYFDFGRYHAPHGKGRVRSEKTDHDLVIKTVPIIDQQSGILKNIDNILLEIASNKSCHGYGELLASYCPVNFNNSFNEANGLQLREFINYGPFITEGTNCSRFVNRVILKGNPSWFKKFLLRYPATLTSTPFWNVVVVGNVLKIIKIKPDTSDDIYKESKNKVYGKSCITTRA